jgi:glycosyltransferase involved in cell wall biosynthesis
VCAPPDFNGEAGVRISVVLATYNSPAWLEKVLWGYATQSRRPDEIVIADDGSTQETLLTIERMKRAFHLPLKHVWHEDNGFRKCEILNKAILASTGDYLVFSDGDCIPRRDFLAVHAELSAPNRFLSGGLVRLPLELSQRIDADDVLSGRAWSASWLIRSGLTPDKKCLLIAAPRSLAAAMDRLTPTRATWNGHNASGWRNDLLRVNGFDERMGYGGEDRELGERLLNAGVRPMQIRHRAICVHLDHGRGYVDADVIRWNQLHRRSVRTNRVTWTEFGIRKEAMTEQGASLRVHSPQTSASLRRAA